MNPQDPLSQLRDIQLPTAISWWPPAPGWWIVAAIVLGLACLCVWYIRRRYLQNSFRRQASQLLQQHFDNWQHQHDDHLYLQQLNGVLKRIALLRYPEVDVAGLSGEHWTVFLDSCLSDPYSQKGFSHSALIAGPYSPSIESDDIPALHAMGLNWLQQHKVPRDA